MNFYDSRFLPYLERVYENGTTMTRRTGSQDLEREVKIGTGVKKENSSKTQTKD